AGSAAATVEPAVIRVRRPIVLGIEEVEVTRGPYFPDQDRIRKSIGNIVGQMDLGAHPIKAATQTEKGGRRGGGRRNLRAGAQPWSVSEIGAPRISPLRLVAILLVRIAVARANTALRAHGACVIGAGLGAHVPGIAWADE